MATGLDDLGVAIVDKEITLIPKDGKEKVSFKVSSIHASISGVVKSALLDPDMTEIPLKQVEAHTLEKIVEYMKKREGKDLPELKFPIKHRTMAENCGDEWCGKFIDKVAEHRKQFYDLLLATVRLDIKGLQSLGVGKIACLLKFCDAEDLDRVLDPNITDGKLLPLRQEIKEQREKSEAERKLKREKMKKEREMKKIAEKKSGDSKKNKK